MDFLVMHPFPQTLPSNFSTYLHRNPVYKACLRMRMAKVGTVKNWWWQSPQFSEPFCKRRFDSGRPLHSSLNTRKRILETRWTKRVLLVTYTPSQLPCPHYILIPSYRKVMAFKISQRNKSEQHLAVQLQAVQRQQGDEVSVTFCPLRLWIFPQVL